MNPALWIEFREPELDDCHGGAIRWKIDGPQMPSGNAFPKSARTACFPAYAAISAQTVPAAFSYVMSSESLS
jgi:hypothetical protein